jgi:adenylosuccinate lyase
MQTDLDQAWEVLGEAVQTVMRKYGLAEPYEQLKAATRGQRLDATTFAVILDALRLPSAARAELASLRPESYLGFAADLARNPR